MVDYDEQQRWVAWYATQQAVSPHSNCQANLRAGRVKMVEPTNCRLS